MLLTVVIYSLSMKILGLVVLFKDCGILWYVATFFHHDRTSEMS